MDNFGSEVGQKMRSAVKAKLLELGTGGSAGYIDDELPDYVMIMVANKRSKQQMIADLNLFLGTQTELFVTWLHEVLHKLQEVTIPAAAVVQKKRKGTNQREDTVAVAGGSTAKKDKKTAKKEKRSLAKKLTDGSLSAAAATGTEETFVPVIPSITDVFAGEFLEKAKTSLEIEANILLKPLKNHKKSPGPSETTSLPEDAGITESVNEFDIPTISQINTNTTMTTSTTVQSVGATKRDNDIAELAEIQKKIYAAKKHLKNLEESEDEDFLNIKEDGSGEDFDEAGDLIKKQQQQQQQQEKAAATGRPKSPIVFDRNNEVANSDDTNKEREQARGQENSSAVPFRAQADSPTETDSKRASTFRPTARQSPQFLQRDNRDFDRNREREHERERQRDRERDRERERERRYRDRERETLPKKRSIHERLGLKTTKGLDASDSNVPTPNARRAEKELYIPAFRRKEMALEQRGRNRERRGSQEPAPRQKSIVRTSLKTNSIERKRRDDDRTPTPESSPPRQRVVSRVIVAAPKIEPDSSDDNIERPVSSVITIKPRPPVSPSKQACKNLLLRAVAEAQRSTILVKPRKEPTNVVRSRSPLERNTKFFTKSYRDRLKREGASSNLFRRTAQNLVIEVDATLSVQRKRCRRDSSVEILEEPELAPTSVIDDDEEEYVPEQSISDHGESDVDMVYVPQAIHSDPNEDYAENDENHHQMMDDAVDSNKSENKTQFVVTMNEDKANSKYTPKTGSSSPISVRHNGIEEKDGSSSSLVVSKATSKYRYSRERKKLDLKDRFKLKSSSASSPSSLVHSVHNNPVVEQELMNSSPSSNTPPRPSSAAKKTELIEVYRKPKEVRKIIIQNDSEDDDPIKPKKRGEERVSKSKSPKASCPREPIDHEHKEATISDKRKHTSSQESRSSSSSTVDVFNNNTEETARSSTPSMPSSSQVSEIVYTNNNNTVTPTTATTKLSPLKRKRTPIKFDLEKGNDKDNDAPKASKRRSSKSDEHDSMRPSCDRHSEAKSPRYGAGDDIKQRISIRNTETKKYENIPALSSVAIDSLPIKANKLKERCKYHPTCTKDNCEFYHSSAPCKSFPNCKFSHKCLYTHPKCKFDMTCTKIGCNFAHTVAPKAVTQTGAPPLSSHVVPVQNYKSISITAPSLSMCKYYPNCSKPLCTFFHPKICRFGKNCINKQECNYYHHEVQSSSKFKWVASIG